jgi:ubiquinone/menaquinone biosynthesis C-methylase UbiE
LINDPEALSDVVRFDMPRLGDISNLDVVHLQCHIGTDTLSLARLGARSVVGLDFSSASLHEARQLVADADCGKRVRFVEAEVEKAVQALGRHCFDVVYTGIGALYWLPDIKAWAKTVSELLRPGGMLFIREAHPIWRTLDETTEDGLKFKYPYFEQEEPMLFEFTGTYVPLESGKAEFEAQKAVQWNRGLAEIVQAVIESGLQIVGLHEHQSLPWDALPGRMLRGADGKCSTSAPGKPRSSQHCPQQDLTADMVLQR